MRGVWGLVPARFPVIIFIGQVKFIVRIDEAFARLPDVGLIVPSSASIDRAGAGNGRDAKLVQSTYPGFMGLNGLLPVLGIEVRAGRQPGCKRHLWQQQKIALLGVEVVLQLQPCQE